MATYYVGIGGNNANAGTSWAQRKATLNGAEDIPVAAGDTVYVGPGTYRETLTVDVSGTAEAGAISYIGDYDGSHTTGTKGEVRITGSDNDLSATRVNCIVASSKNYRTFNGFRLDGTTGVLISLISCTDTIVSDCYFEGGTYTIQHDGAGQLRTTVRNCVLNQATYGLFFTHSAAVNDTGHSVTNCLFIGASKLADYGIRSSGGVGGFSIKNCLFRAYTHAVRVTAALTAGQTITVNNCIIYSCYQALMAPGTGQIVENYNNFYGCGTDRVNVDIGANSTSYIISFDSRWFFEMLNGGTMLTPFDLASYSGLVNVAGLSPTTADMRGTGKIGAEREWGALEYDPNLDIEAGSGGSGGAVRISPAIGRLG